MTTTVRRRSDDDKKKHTVPVDLRVDHYFYHRHIPNCCTPNNRTHLDRGLVKGAVESESEAKSDGTHKQVNGFINPSIHEPIYPPIYALLKKKFFDLSQHSSNNQIAKTC